ncbi:MAG: hypothetical protein ACP5EN_06820, partial [Rhodovulum sp.]
MLRDVLILGAAAAGMALFLSPMLRQSAYWRAMVTPLASIIGSGFLVLGPILNDSLGYLAPAAMVLLALVAYLFGAAIRFNIAHPCDRERGGGAALEVAAGWMLAFSYVVSVAYYLNLLGAFAVRLTPFNDPFHARCVTTAVFGVILGVGWTRGFAALEGMEKYTVSLNLSAILGLLVGFALFFGEEAVQTGPVVTPPSAGPWA